MEFVAGYSESRQKPCVILSTTEGVDPAEVIDFAREIGAALIWGWKYIIQFPGEEPGTYYPEGIRVKILEGRELTRAEKDRAYLNSPFGPGPRGGLMTVRQVRARVNLHNRFGRRRY